MINIIKKYKNIITYLFFGVASTILNIGVYQLCFRTIGFQNIPSNIIAWIITILFVFITNKLWVFKNDVKDFDGIIKEFIKFIGCRIATGVLDMIIMYIGVDLLSLNSLIIKAISNIIVIVLNFVFSKLIIFKNK